MEGGKGTRAARRAVGCSLGVWMRRRSSAWDESPFSRCFALARRTVLEPLRTGYEIFFSSSESTLVYYSGSASQRWTAELTSMVAGGLEEMSSTTRLTPCTSLVMRLETAERKSYGKGNLCVSSGHQGVQ